MHYTTYSTNLPLQVDNNTNSTYNNKAFNGSINWSWVNNNTHFSQYHTFSYSDINNNYEITQHDIISYVKYIWNNSYLYCGCRWKWRVIIAVKFSNLSNWKEEAWRKSGLQRDTNPWPPRYRCDALPTELWERGQFIEFIFFRAVKWCEICMK